MLKGFTAGINGSRPYSTLRIIRK